jgi:AcrR family transcriptional regulator
LKSGDDSRSVILDVAYRLFLDVGYEQTTIRQISEAAKASTGSIYHFFGSKDGILSELVTQMFEASGKAADAAFGKRKDPLYRLALELASQLQLLSINARLAEIYAAAYRSWPLTELILRLSVQRNKSILAERLPHWGDDQFFAAGLAIRGLLATVVDERLHLNRLSLNERVGLLLTAVLPLFEADSSEVKKISKAVHAALAEQAKLIRGVLD